MGNDPDRASTVASGEAVPSAAWTPGPWRVRGIGPAVLGVVAGEVDSGNPAAAAVAYVEGGQHEYANAHLIAAAPELYEALRGLADSIQGAWPSLTHLGPMVAARAALAKADGR